MHSTSHIGESKEFRFHDSSRFRKKAGDAKLPFFLSDAFIAFARLFHKFVLKHAMPLKGKAAKESECRPLQVHIAVQVR